MNYLSRVFFDEKRADNGNASERTIAKVMALFDGHGSFDPNLLGERSQDHTSRQ
jgi:hypothetical protein